MVWAIEELKGTRYELPPQGISLVGYVARRMHKTAWLMPVADLLAKGETVSALRQVGLYAAACASSYGVAHYQPSFNQVGAGVEEADPITGARVKVTLVAAQPKLRIGYEVRMPDGGVFSGEEDILGTRVSLRGLGMPAPSRFFYERGNYWARLMGLVTSEIAPGLLRWNVRAFGSLELRDSAGNVGTLSLSRRGEAQVLLCDGKGGRLSAKHSVKGQ